MNNRHTPQHPGAMTPAQLEERFFCTLGKVLAGATATAIFTAILILFS